MANVFYSSHCCCHMIVFNRQSQKKRKNTNDLSPGKHIVITARQKFNWTKPISTGSFFPFSVLMWHAEAVICKVNRIFTEATLWSLSMVDSDYALNFSICCSKSSGYQYVILLFTSTSGAAIIIFSSIPLLRFQLLFPSLNLEQVST